MHDPRITFFDNHAASWDTSGPDIQGTLDRLSELEDRLELAAGQSIMEIGCGTGQITQWLADRVHPGRVVAVDFSSQMLAQARKKDIQAEFRQADVCKDSLGNREYDTVLCFHSFPHFRDQRAALRNFVQALRPNGRLFVVHLAGSEEINHFHDHVGGAVAGDYLPQSEAWDELLASAGLKKDVFIDEPTLFFLKASLK